MKKIATALLMTLALAGATLPAMAHGENCGCGRDHPCSCPKR